MKVLPIISLLFIIVHVSGQSVGTTIKGKFDGGKKITAKAIRIKKGHVNPIGPGTIDEWAVAFNSESIKPINIGCCGLRLVNEGDLLGNGRDCLSVLRAPENGCTYKLTTYCFIDGEWKIIIEPFVVANGCQDLGNDDLQKQVFKAHDGTIMYLKQNPDDEESRAVPAKAVLK